MPHATRNSNKAADTAKRYAVNLDWQKDSKIKTCKCSVCGDRVGRLKQSFTSSRCRRSSRHCTGLISTTIPDERWQPLLGVSLPLWGELLGDENFCKSSGFNEKNFVMAMDESEDGKPPVSWIRSDARFSCSPNEQVMGQIDPSKLAAWLYAHCTHFEVKFLFSTQPVGVEQDKAGGITGLRVTSSMTAKSRFELIECSRLVLAAGPFTPSLLATLSPHRQLALENNPRLYQWVQIKGAGLPKFDKAAVIMQLPEGARFQGPAQVAARQGMIEISRLYSAIPDYILDHDDATRERVGNSTPLRFIAAETLSLPGIHLADRRHTSQGVSIVSTGNESSPVIGKVPGWLVGSTGKASRASTGDESRGVWLAYGFGAFGTTIAPGVARLLAQLVLGEEPEIDPFDFAVTELEVLDGIGLEHQEKKLSKGKGKARR
ncbi:uncharacterized protein MYCFIDRAFT_75885 [Pseudocercospora fijiensis CIRAD86]|uniref:FAD-dependent oxidoreductase domain-containing protein 1 n=1 Tax=Pseudocercospora fijiensis (strain CIRAD86) TaxID=383855 RepID=N1Q6K6_PSEFD|nr:uncharacterized protein MYCFIDRAFT_75885 [Pseudocercospora fijiensis CIRAD86]EME88049.1 hypothetical protein MYCFIDRAFT_75885 [Pseudocercospora fijiensis CIRAD86]